MNALAKWIESNGSQKRKALFLRIKASFPRFTQTSLSQYKKGKRIPPYDIAVAMAEFTGLPLEEIPYRYVNKPNGDGEATKK